MEPRDVEGVMAVQATCPEIAQWTVWDYERVAQEEMGGWVAEDEGEVLGFIVARRLSSDLEILNFAVRSEARKKGFGSALFKAVLDWGKSFEAENALLEVRASNIEAIRFYEARDFRATGRRPRYYVAPVEDALLLTAQISAE
jgi:ribosomal-protein-alanine N-acetyltransferase